MEKETLRVKGAGVRAALAWFTKTHGESAREVLLARLPEEQRALTRTVLPSSWYPGSLAGNLMQGLAAYAPAKDKATLEKFYKEINRYIAEENLSTFYRALLVLMTPDRLFEILPRLWATYYQGIEVTLVRTPKTSRGTCTVRGLGHIVPYLGCGACGWLEFAFAKVGGRLKISEEGWSRGRERVDPLVYDLDWS